MLFLTNAQSKDGTVFVLSSKAEALCYNTKAIACLLSRIPIALTYVKI
ncbi:hypothetical protein [Argonema antarcticum]|nr:hypothetical protein [Argonema antarcticum]MCL1474746.1 hypothetical protein [Argonema antarcticum A004/B2]